MTWSPSGVYFAAGKASRVISRAAQIQIYQIKMSNNAEYGGGWGSSHCIITQKCMLSAGQNFLSLGEKDMIIVNDLNPKFLS